MTDAERMRRYRARLAAANKPTPTFLFARAIGNLGVCAFEAERRMSELPRPVIVEDGWTKQNLAQICRMRAESLSKLASALTELADEIDPHAHKGADSIGA